MPVDRLLLGVQNRVPAAEFAAETGNLRWPSTRVVDGPHVALLRQGGQGDLSDAAILAGGYAEMARRCIAINGCFFWATDEHGITDVARDFIARHRGQTAAGPRAHQSAPDSTVMVAPVQGSDCFQVIDGHHRAASAIVRGEVTIRVQVKWLPVATPLQQMLTKMSWLDGTRELYQPVAAPELERSWTTVRSCSDRLEKMLALLSSLELGAPEDLRYLDVASCYGWFVAQLKHAGFDAHGIERDSLALPLGQTVYGLEPGDITAGDAVDFLSSGEQWDVVSCFSLLHHFVLGRGAVGAEELVQLLDKATGRVLFLDTGQEHEDWFRESLRGWTSERVRTFLLDNTTFDDVLALGADRDAVPPYESNYGRQLFACIRKP